MCRCGVGSGMYVDQPEEKERCDGADGDDPATGSVVLVMNWLERFACS